MHTCTYVYVYMYTYIGLYQSISKFSSSLQSEFITIKFNTILCLTVGIECSTILVTFFKCDTILELVNGSSHLGVDLPACTRAACHHLNRSRSVGTKPGAVSGSQGTRFRLCRTRQGLKTKWNQMCRWMKPAGALWRLWLGIPQGPSPGTLQTRLFLQLG